MPVTNTVGKKAQLKQSGGVMVRSPGIWEAEREVLRLEEPMQRTKTLPQANKRLCSQQLYSGSLCCYPDHVYTLWGKANR